MAEITNYVAHNRVFELVDPENGDLTGIKVELRPGTAPEVKKLKKRWTDETLKAGRKGGSNLNADSLEAKTTNLLLASIAGWEWTVDANGVPATYHGEAPEFTPAKVRQVLEDEACPWIRDQINEEINRDAAFFKS
jgi:hypothetical protein